MIFIIILLVIVVLLIAAGFIAFEMAFAGKVAGPAKLIIDAATQDADTIPGLEENINNAKKFWSSLDKENVEIRSVDGITLRGEYYAQENAKRSILLVHGYRATGLSNFAVVLPTFANNGCNILLIDQRACGRSDGKYTTFGLMERYDVVEWVNWIHERENGIRPIYIDGISMGGATVAMCADLDFPEEMRGIICDCGFTTCGDIIKIVMKKFAHLPAFPLFYFIGFAMKVKTGLGMYDVDSRECLKNSKYPFYFIHGKKDDFVPYEMGTENYDACTSEKAFFTSEESTHGMSFVDKPEECTAFVFELFNKHDGDLQ